MTAKKSGPKTLQKKATTPTVAKANAQAASTQAKSQTPNLTTVDFFAVEYVEKRWTEIKTVDGVRREVDSEDIKEIRLAIPSDISGSLSQDRFHDLIEDHLLSQVENRDMIEIHIMGFSKEGPKPGLFIK
jgi:hypothetical protein